MSRALAEDAANLERALTRVHREEEIRFIRYAEEQGFGLVLEHAAAYCLLRSEVHAANEQPLTAEVWLELSEKIDHLLARFEATKLDDVPRLAQLPAR